jgi:hypothetical protein
VPGLDAELVSAYLDGELDTVLRGRVEEGLRESSRWRAELKRQQRIRSLLHMDSEPDASVVMGRVWTRIVDETEHRGFWRRTVAIPMPALVGGLSLLFFLAFSLVYLMGRGPVGRMEITTAPSGAKHVQVEAPIAELEALLKGLDSDSPSRELIIQLPAGSTVRSVGEPLLLREADLRGRVFR